MDTEHDEGLVAPNLPEQEGQQEHQRRGGRSARRSMLASPGLRFYFGVLGQIRRDDIELLTFLLLLLLFLAVLHL